MNRDKIPFWKDAGDEYDVIARKLNELTTAPPGIVDAVARLEAAMESGKVFAALVDIAEPTAMYLCDIGNVLYLEARRRLEGRPRQLEADVHGGSTSIRKMEQELRFLSSQHKLSFGHYIRALRAFDAWFTATRGVDPPDVERIFGQVLKEPLPPPCVKAFQRLGCLLDARRQWNQVLTYAGMASSLIAASRANAAGQKIGFQQLLGRIVEVRNLSAHPKPDEKKRYVAEVSREDWERITGELLAPAMRALLTWEPLHTILRTVQIVRIVDDHPQDGWTRVKWEGAGIRPLASRMRWGPKGPGSGLAGQRVLARFADLPSDLTFVASIRGEGKPFPVAMKQIDEDREVYGKRFTEYLFADGVITRDEDEALDRTRKELNLQSEDRKLCEDPVWQDLREICEWFAKEHAACVRGGSSTHHEDGHEDGIEADVPGSHRACAASEIHPPFDLWRQIEKRMGLREQDGVERVCDKVRGYLRAHEKSVFAALDDAQGGAATEKSLRRVLNGDKETTNEEAGRLVTKALARLQRDKRVAKIVSEVWRVRDDSKFADMRDLLIGIRKRLEESQADGGKVVVPAQVWTLVATSLDIVGSLTSADPDVIAVLQDLRTLLENLSNEYGEDGSAYPEGAEDAPADAADTSSGASADTGPEGGTAGARTRTRRPPIKLSVDGEIKLTVDGETISARGMTTLIRALANKGILDRYAEAIRARVPRKVGRSRVLVNTEPEHPASGTSDGGDLKLARPFSYPVKVELAGGLPLYFEANFPKQEGRFFLRTLLKECGAQIPEDADTAEQGEEVAGDEQEPQGRGGDPGHVTTSRPAIEVTLEPQDGEAKDISGKNVRTLSEAVIKFLIEDEERRSKLLEALPFVVSRKRYFVHTAPIHPTDKSFYKPLEIKLPVKLSELGADLQDIYVETNNSRAQAVQLLGQLCRIVDVDLLQGNKSDQESIDEDDQDQEEGAGGAAEDGTRDSADARADGKKRPIDLRIELRSGRVCEGRTTRKFFTAVLQALEEADVLSHVKLPYRAWDKRGKRYFANSELVHSDDSPFTTPLAYPDDADPILYIELNTVNKGRQQAIEFMNKLVDDAYRQFDRADNKEPDAPALDGEAMDGDETAAAYPP